jgi:tetratricopeptide (TPR) repeat protein
MKVVAVKFYWRSITTLIAIFLISLSSVQAGQAPQQLLPESMIERELKGDEHHSYQVNITEGRYFSALVNQNGIDVVVRVTDGTGKQILEVDSPNGKQGPEPIQFIAEQTGSYLIEVLSLEKAAPAGRYQIKIIEERAATPADKPRLAAQQLVSEATILQLQRTAVSLPQARTKYQQSLPFWQAAGDRKNEAEALNSMGEICYFLGDAQLSLDYYQRAQAIFTAIGERAREAVAIANQATSYSRLGNQQKALDFNRAALTIQRELGLRRGIAATLSNMGSVYSAINELQKAIDCLNEALPIRRELRDRAGEANTLNNLASAYAGLGELAKAEQIYQEALALSKTMGDRRQQANILHNIGSGQAGK